jgi:hypothetical protein
VERLCELPRDFRRIRTVSLVSLVEQSGLMENPEALSRDMIAAHLRGKPALIEEWEMWSDDQRASPSWAFGRTGDTFSVYSVPAGESMIFEDRCEACAEFIVRIVESVARNASKKSGPN